MTLENKESIRLFNSYSEILRDLDKRIATMKDLIKLMNPKYIEVTGFFTPRGGISIYPYANYGRKGTKYEALAEKRLQNHE